MKKFNYKKFIFSYFLVFLLLGGVFGLMNASLAEEPKEPGIINKTFSCVGSPESNPPYSECTLNDFIKIGVNVSNWILGISGSAALLMFVWGGIQYLISMGSSEQVKKGTDTLKNAVIGLALVFAAYTIIQFAYNAMGLGWNGNTSFPTSTPTSQ